MNSRRRESDPTTVPTTRTGVLAAGGALISAVGSSACCWLPLLLLTFGASAIGLSAWFERYRLPFLLTAGALLTFSFYSVYFRAERCEPGSACANARPTSRRFTKAMLWVSTVFIVAFAAFPKYAGALLPDDPPTTMAGTDTRTVGYTIDGMTCHACAVTLAQRLREVEGVFEASVSYTDRSATVVFENKVPDAPSQAMEAAKALRYSASTATAHNNSERGPPPPG